MKFLAVFSACALLLAFIGCESMERNYGVRIVVPDEYAGLIRIVFNGMGEHLSKQNGERVFTIPPNGVLHVAGDNPFTKIGTVEVQQASGKLIPNASQIVAENRTPDPFAVLFRVVGGTNDGLEFWAVIGTDSDERDFRLSLHDFESGRKRTKRNH